VSHQGIAWLLGIPEEEVAAFALRRCGVRATFQQQMRVWVRSPRDATVTLELREGSRDVPLGRAKLNALIKGSLQEAAIPWGLEIRRYEITEITPDHQIRIAMDKQAAAERDRREHVLRAEGDKQRVQLTSEGVKISLTNESEGQLIKIRNEAEANKQRILLEAEGQAEAIRLTAEAQAKALSMIAEELKREHGSEAARLALAREYAEMYGEMGQKSNTILFNDRPADVNALLSQAVLTMQAATNATATNAAQTPALGEESSETTTPEAEEAEAKEVTPRKEDS